MSAGTQHTKEQKELNTRERKGQNNTKITSASADSRIKSSWKMMSLVVRTLCLYLVLMTVLQHFTFFSQLCDHVFISTDWCSQNEQMDTER